MKAERFESQAALEKAHPNAEYCETGPVHKHGDNFYVSIYLGQHEWLAFNVENLDEAWSDPGWEGTEYGWAYAPASEVRRAIHGETQLREIAAPERAGKPITCDMLLFADRDKLKEYLDSDDPISLSLFKEELNK